MPEKRVLEWEYKPGEEFVLRVRSPRLGVLPAEIRTHARAALKEGLLALRSLFDAAIEGLERSEEGGGQKAERIEVE